MSDISKPAAFYADFGGLAQLKGAAQNQDPKAVREAARQFESLFTQMMLKSMRQANASLPGGDSMMDNDQSDMYRDMFDNQLALQLSKGRGLGLADMLVRQMTQGAVTDPAAVAALKMPNDNMPGAKITTQLPVTSPLNLPSVKSQVAPPARSHSPPTNAPLVAPVATSGNTLRDRSEGAAALRKYMDEMWPIKANTTGAASGLGKDTSAITSINSVAASPSARVAPISRDDRVGATTKSAATTSAVPTTAPRPLANSPAEFVQKMWPHAQAAARELGVDPSTLIAHAALETGWGKFVPCNPDGSCSFNMFGIKTGSRWQGSSVAVNTLEYKDGVAVKQRANFRAYDSPADSFRDYAAFIKNSPRYVAALGTGDDAAKFANALQQGGYATDPNYATKLTATAMGVNAHSAPMLKNFTDQPIIAGSSVSGAVSRGEKT